MRALLWFVKAAVLLVPAVLLLSLRPVLLVAGAYFFYGLSVRAQGAARGLIDRATMLLSLAFGLAVAWYWYDRCHLGWVETWSAVPAVATSIAAGAGVGVATMLFGSWVCWALFPNWVLTTHRTQEETRLFGPPS